MTSDQLSMFAGDDAGKKAAATSFSLTRIINGKQQQVCDHWLMPVLIGEWMFGPKVQAEKILDLQTTVRKNGEFNFRIYRRGSDIDHHGVYRELNIPSRLVFSWIESDQPEIESQVTVQFSAEADKTKLKLQVNLPAELSANKDKIKKTWTLYTFY